MKVTINGETKELENDLTVAELLIEIDTPAVGVAVEINREIVSRSLHATTCLQDGDVLEIVKMVGGG